MTNCRLMTLNLLTDGLYNYGDSRFKLRSKAVKEMIRSTDPDLIGTQEMTNRMMPHLKDILEFYGLCGEGRGSHLSNEYSAILYKKSRYQLLETKTYWLSETPLKKGSKFFFSQFPRIVTMADLKDRQSRQEIRFFNTHLDHNFGFVREKQAAVLLSLIREKEKNTVTFVSGDFNDVPDSETLKILCSDGLSDLVSAELGSTLKGKIGSAVHSQEPIDHILVSCDPKNCTIKKLDQKYAGYYPSDHYPLIADIEY